MRAEYMIFKMCRKKDGGPQPWDGPFPSKSKAMEALKRDYDLRDGGRPVFAVFKVTYERISP